MTIHARSQALSTSSSATSPATCQRTRIRPPSGLIALDLGELWQYRELFLFMTWRHILIRYKQTALGIAWAVIQPLATMVVFTVIFGRLANFDERTAAPYAVMTFAALLPWQFFSNAFSTSSNSLVMSANMISKIYFPRLIVPTSTILAGTVDFLLSLAILAIMMLAYGVQIQPQLVLLPIFFLLAFFASLACGLWLSALNVTYRDVKFVVPFVVKMGLYISPVGFMSSIVPEQWRFWYSLNPMVGVIDGFRWAILGPEFEPYWPGFWASMILVTIVFVTGAYYFKRTELTFADNI